MKNLFILDLITWHIYAKKIVIIIFGKFFFKSVNLANIFKKKVDIRLW